jgi:hypothetical protein
MTHPHTAGRSRAEVAEHVRDAQRDALAVYRTVLTDDREGLAAILAGGGCRHCLVVTLALIGLSLAVRSPADLGPAGTGWSDSFAADVLVSLTLTQAAHAGPRAAFGGLS